jgi:hypothetical protein
VICKQIFARQYVYSALEAQAVKNESAHRIIAATITAIIFLVQARGDVYRIFL